MRVKGGEVGKEGWGSMGGRWRGQGEEETPGVALLGERVALFIIVFFFSEISWKLSIPCGSHTRGLRCHGHKFMQKYSRYK